MTIQLAPPLKFGASKAVLEDALNQTPNLVNFVEPSPFGSRGFTGAHMVPEESFVCVMDPATRRRFAQVKRMANGSYKVK